MFNKRVWEKRDNQDFRLCTGGHYFIIKITKKKTIELFLAQDKKRKQEPET